MWNWTFATVMVTTKEVLFGSQSEFVLAIGPLRDRREVVSKDQGVRPGHGNLEGRKDRFEISEKRTV